MNGKHRQPKTLQEAILYFSDPDNCLNYMIRKRWPDGVVTCPSCERKGPVFLANQRKWQCKSVHAKRQFSVKVGTIFEDSPISLDKWLTAMWMICNCKNGVSSYEVARTIGVTQKSAWFMMHRIRLAMRKNPWDHRKIGGSGSEVEVDETFIGGKLRNMHAAQKIRYEKRGGSHGKAIVQGMIDRETRQVRAKMVPDIKRETLQTEVMKQVLHGLPSIPMRQSDTTTCAIA